MERIDWAELFLPGEPLLETVIRGSVMYLSLFCLLRFTIKREAGSLGLTDLLVVVLLADAAQNGMSGQYESIGDGLVLVVTVVFWSYLLDYLAFHYPFWRRIVRPPRVQLVADGRILRDNLEREKITEEELISEIRTHGCDDVTRVRAAYIESDGMISVITSGRGRNGADRPSRKGGGLSA